MTSGEPRGPGLARARPREREASGDAHWRSTEDAAVFLGMPVRVLRETIAEHARIVDGVAEARFDGIVARRIGRRWKVWLAPAWTAPETRERERRGAGTFSAAESTGRGGKESPHGRA